MVQRREFLKSAAIGTAGCVLASSLFRKQSFAEDALSANEVGFRFTSPNMVAELSRNAPEFVQLNIDGLGLSKRGVNALRPPIAKGYSASLVPLSHTHRIEYRLPSQKSTDQPVWTAEFSSRTITLASNWSENVVIEPFALQLDRKSVV
jgi:hypothetical protein